MQSRAGRKTVSFGLGRFAFEALGGREESLRTVEARVGRAIGVYWRDRDEGRPEWAPPALESSSGETVPVAVELDADVLAGLTASARRSAISIDLLLNHAALYYLAELDRGQLTRRILDDLPKPDDAAA